MISRYRKYVKSKKAILSVIFLIAIFIWHITISGNGSEFLEVNFFDIGQGDAIFIEDPDGKQILIDGGPSSIILEKLGKEMDYFDKSIDVVIATHPDKDHISGLIDVLKYYEIGELWMTNFGKDTSFYEELAMVIKRENISTKIVGRGDYFNIGKLNIDILHPLASASFSDAKINDVSVVARISYGNISFLFTGDITQITEKELVEYYHDFDLVNPIDADILKVSHHGSKSSSSNEFLKFVSPEIAVIQVGEDNPYNHPHIDALNRLNDIGVKILRNDLLGDIKIISDGNNYTIEF